MKKTLITLTTAAAFSIAALAPAATPASARPAHFSFGIYGDGFSFGMHSGHRFGRHHFGHGHRRHCTRVWRKIWTPGGPIWKKVRVCRRHHRHF